MTTYGENGIKRERRTDRPNERGGPAGSFVPDNAIDDAAANRANEHRCQAPRPGSAGDRWGCTCGTIFEWRNSFTGWAPVYDPKEQLPHSHGGRADEALDTYVGDDDAFSLDALIDGFDDAEAL